MCPGYIPGTSTVSSSVEGYFTYANPSINCDILEEWKRMVVTSCENAAIRNLVFRLQTERDILKCKSDVT